MPMGRIFVVGDLNLDMLLYTRKLPRPGEEVHADSLGFSIGGNAANFTLSLARLGQRPELYAGIGDDFAKGFLMKELLSSGADLHLKKVPGPNGYTAALVLPGGERCFVSNKGASGELTVKDLAPLLDRLETGDILYTGGLFHLPKLTRGYDRFLSKAKRRGATLLFDSTFDCRGCGHSFRGLAPHLDMVFMNEDEAKGFGKTLDSSLEAISKLGVTDVIVKLGGKGSLFYNNGMARREPAVKVKPRDTTGAGDVFNAGFVHGFMSGLTPEQSLRLGNWVASYKVARTGIAVPPRERVKAIIEKLG